MDHGCGCFVCVRQSSVGVLEQWGKYSEVLKPGCHCLCPCRDSVAGLPTLRIQEHSIVVESKTKDNVFVNVRVVILYQYLPDNIVAAFYSLSNPILIMSSYVHDGIRGQVPFHDLSELYLIKSEMADKLKKRVDEQMECYGIEIVRVMILTIEPAKSVVEAMNSITLYQRQKVAELDRAEAIKFAQITAGEAQAEASRLSGVGAAEMRNAVASGLAASIEAMSASLGGISSNDVLTILLINQYFDLVKDVAAHSRGTALYLPHAGGLQAVADSMQHSIFSTPGSVPVGTGVGGIKRRAIRQGDIEVADL